jgi:hypothetical protein
LIHYLLNELESIENYYGDLCAPWRKSRDVSILEDDIESSDQLAQLQTQVVKNVYRSFFVCPMVFKWRLSTNEPGGQEQINPKCKQVRVGIIPSKTYKEVLEQWFLGDRLSDMIPFRDLKTNDQRVKAHISNRGGFYNTRKVIGEAFKLLGDEWRCWSHGIQEGHRSQSKI